MDGIETPPENTIAGEDQWKLPVSGIDDRLSSLPDKILYHILSLLPTKYVVGTAVQSRRWTDLWTRVCNLDFDNKLAYNQLGIYWVRDSPTQLANRVRRDWEFSRFVDRILSQHSNLNSVRRFRLHFEMLRHNWRLRSDFVRNGDSVFGSQVEEIDVSLVRATECGSPARIWWLSESFYTLKNLEVVKLHSVMMGVDGLVSLPSVKILQLRQVVIEDFQVLNKLISGCPVLETLDLHDCDLEDWNENYILTASLPSLRNLMFYVDIDVNFLGSRPLSCLHSARVDIGESRSIAYHCLMALLTQISNAKEMSLDWPTLESLSDFDDVQLPAFPNLTHLTIKPTGSSCILHSLLHSASKLQVLVIDLGMVDQPEPMTWEESEPACAPKCLLSSLEEIEIKGLSTDEDGIKMVSYLLKAGAVLKKVNMHALNRIDRRKSRELALLLRRLPKGSSACDVRLLHCSREMIISGDHEEEVDN